MNAGLKKILESVGRSGRNVGGRMVDEYLAKLSNQIVSAGDPGEIRAIELFGIQILLLFMFPVVWGLILYKSSLVSFLFEGPKQFLFYGVLMLAGFYFPLMNIRERARARQREIQLQLPDTLDLLTISVEAGLDFESALKTVTQKHRPGALRNELELFFNRMVGMNVGKEDALRELAGRVQLQDLSSVVSVLIQAIRFGTPIGEILRTQSDMLRIRRSQRAEKAAGEAPVKMLAPLIVCILPCVFIMILAPVFIQMWIDLTGK